MKNSRRLAVLAATAALLAGGASAASASAAAVPAPSPRPASLTGCSAAYFQDDSRLGPAQLPLLGPVGLELIGYRRTGGLPERVFLADYYSATANQGQGGWIYPPDNGYVIAPDGKPIEHPATLKPGQQIDRFGSERGTFLAPAGLSYAERSIPPQSLEGTPAEGCNYHVYRVEKPFEVDAGPIAPWFGQPGDGEQYQLDATLFHDGPATLNVLWLVENGYLARVV